MVKDPLAAEPINYPRDKDRERIFQNHAQRIPELWIGLPNKLPSGELNARLGYARHVAEALDLKIRFFTNNTMRFSDLTRSCGEGQEHYAGFPVTLIHMRDTYRGNHVGINEFIAEQGICPEILLAETPFLGGFEKFENRKLINNKTIEVLEYSKERPFGKFVDTTIPVPFIDLPRPEPTKTRFLHGETTYWYTGPAMHNVTFEQVEQSKQEGLAQWGNTPQPRLMISCAELSGDTIDRRVKHIIDLLRDSPQATIFLSPSPRTDIEAYRQLENALKQEIAKTPDANQTLKDVRLISYHNPFSKVVGYEQRDLEESHIEDTTIHAGQSLDQSTTTTIGKAENPYWQWVSMSDANMILGESQSMMGDALMTGSAIYFDNMDLDDEKMYQRVPEASRFIPIGGRRYRFEKEETRPLCTEQFEPYNITEHYADQLIEKYKTFKAERDDVTRTDTSEQTASENDESLGKFTEAEHTRAENTHSHSIWL